MSGVSLRVCRPHLTLLLVCAFFDKHMATNYIHIGTYNDNSQDHHREMTVNVPAGTNVTELVRAFFGNTAEDVQAEECTDAKNATVHTNDLFCRITQHAIDDNKAQAVEDDLRKACVDAPTLVKAIRINEALDYLDTQNLKSKELYEMLNNHFGLSFKQHTFAVYRSKRAQNRH